MVAGTRGAGYGGRGAASRSSPGARRLPPRSGASSALPFDLRAFRAVGCGRSRPLPWIVGSVPGFRPTLNPQPFEALVVAITTQQISLQRGSGHPRQPRRALRRTARGRVGVPDPRADPRAATAPLHPARVLPREGGVRPRARAQRPRSRRPRRSLGRRWGDRCADVDPRAWAAGPRTGSSRDTSHDRTRGRRVTSACARQSRRSTLPGVPCRSRRSVSMSERFAPFENLSAQFLLAGREDGGLGP